MIKENKNNTYTNKLQQHSSTRIILIQNYNYDIQTKSTIQKLDANI